VAIPAELQGNGPLQKQFGYDPQKAAAWQMAEQKAAAERANTERRQELLRTYASQDLPDPLEVGAIGKFGRGVVVFQAIDANKMLLYRRWYWHSTSPFCLQGLPTSDHVDGGSLEPAWTGAVVKVTGTMHYKNVNGGRSTIFVVEPYDVK